MKIKILTIILLILATLLIGCQSENKNNEQKVLEKEFEKTTEQMENMVSSLQDKKIEEAIEHFNIAHDFFHDINPELSEKNGELAQKLWDEVGSIEGEIELGNNRLNPNILKEYAMNVIDMLEEAKKELIK